MKKSFIILFLMFISTSIFSQSYISNYAELYLYDSIANDYFLSDTLCKKVEIDIDTLFDNKIYFIQEINKKPFCLNNIFNIKKIDYNEEENIYYYFIEEFNRDYRVEFTPQDSSLLLILEKKYTIFYKISEL